MKKFLILLCIIILALVYFKDDSIVIPASAIRFRVIANSNSIHDQLVKNNLSINLENYLADLTKDSSSSNEANETFLINYNKINNYIDNYLKENKVKEHFKLSIGKNYFPNKEYKGIKYNAGYYDSVVVNLGAGNGLNWWCVIYPPLCLIDENTSDVKYTTIANELLHKI